MGLDFSHCDARWAYSAFMRFRVRLAAEVGIALHCMEGFAESFSGLFTDGKLTPCDTVKIYDSKTEDKSHPAGLIGYQPVIKWSKVNDDIVPLLNHSDCDGRLTPKECKKVAPRLRELIKDWADDDRDKVNALLLAEGMEEAARKRQNLRFI